MNAFKSGKQRRAEIKAARYARRRLEKSCGVRVSVLPSGRVVPVDCPRLMPNNSYDVSVFSLRGDYVDRPFICCDCGVDDVWTAKQQHWWYKTLGGSQYATAKRCYPCRLRERQRKAEARRASEAGLLRKKARLAAQERGWCQLRI